jgi:ADP-ribose pyrophosphatase
MSGKTFHFAFGSYGIIHRFKELLVIKKNGGPYINRYDLPGGSLDEGEPLDNTVIREVAEETGLKVTKSHQLGTVSFRFPWKYQRYTWNEHVCVFNLIEEYQGEVKNTVTQFIGQDSLGAVWVPLTELNLENSSPLVIKARDYLLTNEFETKDTEYPHWKVLS